MHDRSRGGGRSANLVAKDATPGTLAGCCEEVRSIFGSLLASKALHLQIHMSFTLALHYCNPENKHAAVLQATVSLSSAHTADIAEM